MFIVAKKMRFLNIRSPYGAYDIKLTTDYSVHSWMFDREFPEVYRNLFLGMIVQPFIEEDQKELEDSYLSAAYSFEHTESKIAKQECLGLAAALLYEMPAISVPSLKIWEQGRLHLIIETQEETRVEPVLNIANPISFQNVEIASFIESISNVKPVNCDKPPNEKLCHLSDHHGKSELQEFWHRIKKCPYVREARSTSWGGKRFIRKITKDGQIEIVLTNTDRQYAMLVYTTEKNLTETKEIAAILERDYS